MGTSDDITRLREGSMIDYGMRTWEVTDHDTYDDVGWPADVWMLQNGTDVRFLEHEYDNGDVFRLSEPARISEITVEDYHGHKEEPFLTAIREEDAPSTIRYQGQRYVLAEEDARVGAAQMTRTSTGAQKDELTRSATDSVFMGVCGGYAEYNNLSSSSVRLAVVGITIGTNFITPCLLMPVFLVGYYLVGRSIPKGSGEPSSVSESRSRRRHYWVYENSGEFVALECTGSNDWDAYAGHEVEPFEFNNILPGRSD